MEMAMLASAPPFIHVLCRMRVLYAHVSTSYSIFCSLAQWQAVLFRCLHIWATSQPVVKAPRPWLGAGQSLAQTVALLMCAVPAANCAGHHTSSIVQGLQCLLLSRTGRKSNISIIPGIPHRAAVLPPMGQYFPCWEKAGVPCIPHHPSQGCSVVPVPTTASCSWAGKSLKRGHDTWCSGTANVSLVEGVCWGLGLYVCCWITACMFLPHCSAHGL